ncbi:KAP family P-loop NTPase fold protein [Butyrivibrio sp. AE3004]|uniref:KAP family P-loop NTPase fold protein n=1 Tax=Butyrivibrio sp. AE3004 TaxID=1506994 RepID=UPI000A4E2687|nr:P-loop NTPase fold protein [Butyrivibrio sp. AE3004]
MIRTMGYPDKPVASINEDLFNVEVYVNALCSFIRSCETPMTISIQGDWGSGKTSMMNMMKANMQGAVWPIWFNTWQFSQFDMGNALAFSMMDVILKGLDCENDVRKKIINGLIGFGKRVVRNVSDYTLGGEITGVISNSLEGPAQEVDFASEISELKDKFRTAVDSKLEKEHRDRVVVFVDDLDRLQPAKAVELLEVLKLFLDCDKCVFVLAVDYEVVTLGIRQKYGNEVTEEKGRSFFDKIIQLPFKMPVASYDIHRYVRGMMKKMNISDSESEVTLFFNLIQTSIGFNPRSMKRLFNTYELLDIVTESTVRNIDDDVRKRILFAIICVQMCYEKLYLYFTSTRIDGDTFAAFTEDALLDAALREIYGIGSDDSCYEIDRVKVFIPHFMDALQMDGDKELSEEEISNFKTILKSSVVTSVNATTETADSDSKEWEYRNRNKDIVKETAEKLRNIGKFTPWMPRKAREGVKFSDISGWYAWNVPVGFDCTLEYYLSRISEFIISVSVMISLRDGKGMEQKFFDVFGDNPLKLNIVPVKEEWGRYIYNNVLRVNANDTSIADQIATITKNAYEAVNEKVNNYEQ